MFKIGIIGLPNVGKSSLFKFITKQDVKIANFPFSTITPNVAIIKFIDKRIREIQKISNFNKIVFPECQIIDIAGLVKGSSQGYGLGNQFLNKIKEVNIIIHLLKCFTANKVINIKTNIIDNINTVDLELILSDLNICENALIKLKSKFNFNNKIIDEEILVIKKIQQKLKQEYKILNIELNHHEKKIIKKYNFLTNKPVFYIANIDEKFINNPLQNSNYKMLYNYCKKKNFFITPIAIKTELILQQLSISEQKILKNEFQIFRNTVNMILKKMIIMLNYSIFFTIKNKILTGWFFKNNMFAIDCAKIIHSNIKKGFIKTEIINYQDYIKYNGWENAKKNGKLKIEGKKYIIKDGEICDFKFNV